MTVEKSQLVWVDEALCARCDACGEVCPNQVFSRKENSIDILHRGRCIECGHCVAVCPEGAFHHAKLLPEKFSPVAAEYPVSPDMLQGIFAQRRSCRQFTDAKVTAEELNALLDAAAAAPTATNSRNVRFLVLDTPKSIAAFEQRTAAYYLKLEKQLKNPAVRFFISLAVGKKTVEAYKYHLPIIAERFRACQSGEQPIFYGAPIVLVAHASGLAHIAAANCNLAVMQIMHKAESMGLGTCYNGYALTAAVRDKTVRKFLDLPKGATHGAVLALGRPALPFHRAPKRRRPRAVSFTPADKP